MIHKSIDTDTNALNPIIFCGAGPGDPDLITVKGQQALSTADLVVYAGSLVPEALLKWTRPDCRHLSSAGLHLDEMVSAMADAWQAGQKVVRLHTGDPSLYGAIFEQMAKLSHHSIPYTVIPGLPPPLPPLRPWASNTPCPRCHKPLFSPAWPGHSQRSSFSGSAVQGSTVNDQSTNGTLFLRATFEQS